MDVVKVALPTSLKTFVEGQVAQGRFDDTSSYIRALIQGERRRKAERRLAALVREADASGPATPFTAEDWENIRRRGTRRVAEEKQRRAKNRKASRRRT